jgi:ferredoxin
MPTIEFLDAEMSVTAVVEAPHGGSLVKNLKDRSQLTISCGSTNCGTCHVHVLTGDEHIEPPGEDEMDLLEVLGGPPEARLGCQLQLRGGEGVIRLVPLVTDAD